MQFEKRSGLSATLTTNLAVIFVCALANVSQAQFTFGTGNNEFTMEFVEIDNNFTGNDTVGTNTNLKIGAVDYEYQIGKYEIRRDFITKYNAEFGTANGLAITMQDMSSFTGNGANKPATGISFNESARFTNWLATSTGGHAAYKFNTSGVNDNIAAWTPADVDDYDPSNIFRSKRATFAIPSRDEHYKGGWYSPSGQNNQYGEPFYEYPNGADFNPPTAVTGGTAAGTAVFKNTFPDGVTPSGPADVDFAGGFSETGGMGFGGNVGEWTESQRDAGDYNFVNNNVAESKEIRGGWWDFGGGAGNYNQMNAIGNVDVAPQAETPFFGFRVVAFTAVPEPNSFMLFAATMGLGVCRRRRKS